MNMNKLRNGKVNSSSERRPNVSAVVSRGDGGGGAPIVKKAGRATDAVSSHRHARRRADPVEQPSPEGAQERLRVRRASV